MVELWLQLVQKKPAHKVMSIQDESDSDDGNELEKWQDYFSELSSNLFIRVGKIRNYKVRAEFFANLMLIQQKVRTVPITLQEKVDGKIDKLIKQC